MAVISPICGWKHWVSKRFGHHVVYGILQEPCLKLLHWPYCYSLFLLNTVCFPAPVPTCTVIKLSCLFRDTQWLPIVYSVTSTWHSWHGLPSAYLSPRYKDHTPQHPESLILRYDQHFYSSVTLLVPILYPVLLFISWSSILESFRLGSNHLSPGKSFLITLIRIMGFPYAPGTFGLCLCCSVDSELTHVVARWYTP